MVICIWANFKYYGTCRAVGHVHNSSCCALLHIISNICEEGSRAECDIKHVNM